MAAISTPPNTVDRFWYKIHLPSDQNPSPSIFLLGLTALPSTSTAYLNKLFTDHYVEHRLWELPHPRTSNDILPAYYAATTAISTNIREKYPHAPQAWVERWVRALVYESLDAPRAVFFDEVVERDEGCRNKGGIPLSQMTFILTVYPTHNTAACILELVMSRCLEAGRCGDRASEYQLSLFYANFQSVLVEKTGETGLDVRRGKLQWIRNGVLETIETQHEFEIAVTHLYHEQKTGWELFFLLLPDGDGVVAAKGKGDGELLKPLVYKPPDTKISKRKENGGASNPMLTESATDQTAETVTKQSAEKCQDGGGEQEEFHDIEIDEVIRKTWNWGREVENAVHTAQLRVQAAREKDKSEKAEVKKPDKSNSAAKPDKQVTQVSSTSKQNVSTAPSSGVAAAAATKQTAKASTKELDIEGKQSVLTSTNLPSSSQSHSTVRQESDLTSRTTSSDALPRVRTDTDRTKKINRVRREVPAHEKPILQPAENTLLASRGSADEALVKPEVPAKDSKAIPRHNSSAQSTAKLNTIKSGTVQKTVAVNRKTESSSSRNVCKSLAQAPATRERGPKGSLHQRFQNAAHSAGRHISLSGSSLGHGAGSSSSVSLSTVSPGIQTVLGSFKRRQPHQTPGEAESKFYEFTVIKEKAYKSGGDDEDAIDPLDGFQKSEEKLESDSENEDGGRPVKKSKDVVSLLKELQNFKGLTQLTEPRGDESDIKRWLDCCRVFQIDPSETGMKERVHIVGIQQPLFQYQAFSVYWQMLNSRRVGGGFVADTPGLGKTLMFLSLIVVERQLSILWDQVNQSRKAKDGKHLYLTGQLPGDECPSQNERPGWIACPCAFSNPTSQMPAQPGVRIAIVPASLMSNWRAEWKKSIDPTCKDLDMRLLLAHEGSVADQATTSQMANWPANIVALRANKIVKAQDSARENQERFLVLTTAQSYDGWIEKFKYGGPRSNVVTLELILLRNKYAWVKGGFKYNIQFGIACADESHEEHIIDKGRAGVLARLPGNPFCWGYTGTPLDKSPRDLEVILWALEKQARKMDPESVASGWAQSKELKPFRAELFDKVCKEFESCVKIGTSTAAAIAKFENRFLPFLTKFMIRHTPETRWFGHTLLTLKSNLHRDVFLGHNGKYDGEIEALAPEIEADAAARLHKLQKLWDNSPEIQRALERPRALGFNNKIHTQYKFRILATCPALIRLTTGENALTLKTDELKKWRGNNEKNSPYAKNLVEIFESSPKLMWLRECILDIEKRRDVDGAEHKMIIITNFNCVAFIVKLMIEHYIPFKKGRVGLMHAEMTTAARTTMLEEFTDATTENKQGETVRKRKENLQFLIGTTPMLSKGLQLTRAGNVVLMEPDHEFFRELQGYARVSRIGQKNPWTFSYRLIDEKSTVEMSILQRQKERGEYPGRVLKPRDLERMGPEDDGASIGESDVTEPALGKSGSSLPKKRLTRAIPTLRRMEKVHDLRQMASTSP